MSGESIKWELPEIARDSSKYFVKIFKPDYKQVFLLAVLHPLKPIVQRFSILTAYACDIRVVIYVTLYVDVFCMPLKSYSAPICALNLFYTLAYRDLCMLYEASSV